MTQKKKRLSLIRSLFLPRGLQSRNMILFLFPVTDILLSQGQSNTLDLLFRFQSLPHQSPIVAPKVFSILRGSVCARLLPVKRALCYLFACGHTFLDWSRKTPTLAQGKQLLQWGQMGLAWRGAGTPPEPGGIQPSPMYIPTQEYYHGHLETCLLPSWCRKGLLYGRWAGSCCYTNTLVPTPCAKDSKTEGQHEKQNKEFSRLRDKEITPAVVRESVGAAVPSAPGGRRVPGVLPAERGPRLSHCSSTACAPSGPCGLGCALRSRAKAEPAERDTGKFITAAHRAHEKHGRKE